MAEARSQTFVHLAALANGFRKWWGNREALRGLKDIGSEERRRLARDFNMSESDLMTTISSATKSAPLLCRMLDALGLDRSRLARDYPQVEWDMIRVCARCPQKGRCRRELEASTAGASFDQFCANATTLAALALDLSSSARRPDALARPARDRYVALLRKAVP